MAIYEGRRYGAMVLRLSCCSMAIWSYHAAMELGKVTTNSIAA